MPFKTVDECAAIGKRLRRLMRGSAPVSVVVVGGGFEGIEALGEVLRAYRRRPRLEIHIVEMAARLMADGPEAIDAMVRRRVADQPVHIHCRETVEKVTPRRVYLRSGERLASDLTIWTGGAAAPPSISEAELPQADDGWIRVRADLSCRGLPGVFAAGDLAELPRPLAKQAYHAIDMGVHAAHNILRRRDGDRPTAFTAAEKPMLVAFGDLDTFLIADSKVVASPLLAAAKEGVFQATIAGFDRLGTLGGLKRAGGRGRRALRNLVLPKFASWRELTRLLSLRFAEKQGRGARE
jgi:NADH dehydrogenase